METGRMILEQFVVLPLQTAFNQLLAFVPSVLGVLVILVIGVTIARLLEQLIIAGLKLVKLDYISDQIQLSAVLARGGIRRKISELIGSGVYWIVILAFVMTALNALNLTIAAQLLQQIVAFLPNVVASVFILIVGIFAAAFLATIVRTAASNAGVAQAFLLGEAVQTIVVIFSCVAALEQLQIKFVGEVFLILLGGLSLAGGIAFGLGCKDMAGRWMTNLVDQLQPKKR